MRRAAIEMEGQTIFQTPPSTLPRSEPVNRKFQREFPAGVFSNVLGTLFGAFRFRVIL
jgi:hypothetical protein